MAPMYLCHFFQNGNQKLYSQINSSQWYPGLCVPFILKNKYLTWPKITDFWPSASSLSLSLSPWNSNKFNHKNGKQYVTAHSHDTNTRSTTGHPDTKRQSCDSCGTLMLTDQAE